MRRHAHVATCARPHGTVTAGALTHAMQRAAACAHESNSGQCGHLSKQSYHGPPSADDARDPLLAPEAALLRAVYADGAAVLLPDPPHRGRPSPALCLQGTPGHASAASQASASEFSPMMQVLMQHANDMLYWVLPRG